MWGLFLGAYVPNLESVSLAILELLAFNPQKLTGPLYSAAGASAPNCLTCGADYKCFWRLWMFQWFGLYRWSSDVSNIPRVAVGVTGQYRIMCL